MHNKATTDFRIHGNVALPKNFGGGKRVPLKVHKTAWDPIMVQIMEPRVQTDQLPMEVEFDV